MGVKRSYSFLDAASRAEHPIVTALVANAAAGGKVGGAFHLLRSMEQDEQRKQLALAQFSERRRMGDERRLEAGRQLALKMGSADVMEDDDPLKPNFEKAFEMMGEAAIPEGFVRDPVTRRLMRKPAPLGGIKAHPVAGEGGIYDVQMGEEGPEARRIPIVEDQPPRPTPTPTQTPAPGAPGAAPSPPPAPTPGRQFLKPQAKPAQRERYIFKDDPKSGHVLRVNTDTGETFDTGIPIKQPAATAGMSQALTNAEYLLDKMQSHFDAAVKKHHPMERWFVGGPASSEHGLISGPAGYADPDAAIHERNRNLVAIALAAPLTGSRRGQQMIVDQIKGGLPSYSDNPKVADEFYKQMHAVIANLRTAYPGDLVTDADDAVYLADVLDAIKDARTKAKQKASGGTPETAEPTVAPTPGGGQSRMKDLLNEAHRKAAELKLQEERKRRGQ